MLRPRASCTSILLAVVCVSCSSTTTSKTPQSLYRIPDQITLTASAVRDLDNGTVIEGSTNLPSNTKLGVEMMTGGRTTAQDFKVLVNSGRFRSAGFRKGVAPLPSGKQTVHIFTHFNSHWQNEAVLGQVGKGGANLKLSPVIHSEDAQLADGEKILDYTVELVIPPVGKSGAKSEAGSSARDKAIESVKKAVLIVDGSRSSETVEGGTKFYFGDSGIRMGTGWSATETGNNTFTVALDFINKVGGTDQHDTAIWEVNTVTRKVLYRNKYAKNFSWIPSY